MVTDTTTIKNRFESVTRDIEMIYKVRQMVYAESKKQDKIYWFPLKVYGKKED